MSLLTDNKPVSTWLKELIEERVDGRSDRELAKADWRTYRDVCELRVKLAAARVYERHATNERTVQLARDLNDPKTRTAIDAFNVRVGLAAFDAEMKEALTPIHAESLLFCHGCGQLTRHQDMVQVRVEDIDFRCIPCAEEVWSAPSTPPANGIASAIARARRLSLPTTLTTSAWKLVVEYFEDRCAYCGLAWCLVEHATPLERGGGTTLDNCLPACMSCNARKGSKTIEEYLAKSFTNQACINDALSWLRQHGRTNTST